MIYTKMHLLGICFLVHSSYFYGLRKPKKHNGRAAYYVYDIDLVDLVDLVLYMCGIRQPL